MKCFFAFKGKSKSQQRGKSQLTPELKPQSGKSGNYPANRETKLAGSVSSPRSIPEMYKEKQHSLRVFSFSELRSATNDFNRLLNIGEGGFGRVYKGTIRAPDGLGDPIVVAIKILNPHGLQGHKQWLAEVKFLSVVDHPNLVKLVGYCCESGESENGESRVQLLLVYEYMPKKSLEDHLFNFGVATLPWKTRLQIILGAAQGLAYLHEGLEVQVIFRDFKASNVLLDEDFKPKLSDFGLAREGPIGDRSHVSTEVLGTLGYAAPEYIDTGHLTRYSDVYSFGVVLYEILTGRRTLERTRPSMEQRLVEWVKQYPADSNKFRMIIDPRLKNQYSVSAARKIAKLADSCLVKNAKDRPTMSHVVESLKQAIEESEMGSSTS
ncbi:probable serine/threonine-protein kinase PBL19 [Actinidia eriantha]|uniref:probable serine/threonine-protein kinase PBL19 n=1 Tax=Actinidia eriantha TaxID=165200 RepID=UPI00258E03FA|nr:probable serine/threonine-protein kinase PBL19 [Actinidia eriantha]